MTDTVGPTCKFIRRHGQRTWRQSRSIAICFLLMTLPESRRAAQRRTQTIVQTPQWLKPQHRHAFDVHLSLQSLCQRWLPKFGLNVQLFRQAKFKYGSELPHARPTCFSLWSCMCAQTQAHMSALKRSLKRNP